MKRFLACVVLLASFATTANAQPQLPTGGVAQGFICYSGNFCGYPEGEQKFTFGSVFFSGVLAIAGKRYVGDFRTTNGGEAYYTSDHTATLPQVNLTSQNYGYNLGVQLTDSDDNELGQTVEGSCSGRLEFLPVWTRVIFDCIASVSGGQAAPVRLVMLFQSPGWLGDGGDGPACVCTDLIGVYFRQETNSSG